MQYYIIFSYSLLTKRVAEKQFLNFLFFNERKNVSGYKEKAHVFVITRLSVVGIL